MIERLQRQVEQHEERLDDHLRRLTVVEAETERTRRRLHRMEADRRAMQALVRTTQKLADQTMTLAQQVSAGVAQTERLAESAAEKAVAKAFDRKKAGRWRLAGRLASHLAGVGAFGSLISYLVAHYLG